jgi:hypothetical protein
MPVLALVGRSERPGVAVRRRSHVVRSDSPRRPRSRECFCCSKQSRLPCSGPPPRYRSHPRARVASPTAVATVSSSQGVLIDLLVQQFGDVGRSNGAQAADDILGAAGDNCHPRSKAPSANPHRFYLFV